MKYLVLGVILGYRLIPKRIRRIWSFGCSTSHIALAKLRDNDVRGMAALQLLVHFAVPARLSVGPSGLPVWFDKNASIEHHEYRPHVMWGNTYDPDPKKWWNN